VHSQLSLKIKLMITILCVYENQINDNNIVCVCENNSSVLIDDDRLMGGATGGPGPASLMNRSKR
jgi:hypothetical protein